MRQLATLPNQREAQRLAAWLVTQRIDAHAEQEADGWVIWVRDEDHLPQAREALAHFREHPDDPRYQNAERTAEAVQRDEQQKRRQAQGRVVEMRGRWGAPGGMGATGRRAPLTLLLIGVAVLIFIATMDQMQHFETAQQRGGPLELNSLYASLLLTDPRLPATPDGQLDVWGSVRRGEVWRLITPIFIHYGFAHFLLNLMWLYSFGGQIEDRRGGRFLLFLVLVLAVTSNVGQALESSLRQMGPHFGGLSGVGYGLFGYLLVKVRYDNRERYFLAPGTAFIALVWFFLCIAREVPPFSAWLQDAMPAIANTAHAVGLFVGAALAYAPLLARQPDAR